MRWLQWATVDLEKGLGGVEVHARSLGRALQGLGIEVRFSRNPQDLLRNEWDVVQTHGSSVLLKEPISLLPRPSNPIRVQTLHGETWGRMKACQEWTWSGGYLASLREWIALRRSDVILTVRKDLTLFNWAQRRGKITRVCGNGWDAFQEVTPLPSSLQSIEGSSFFVFLGRGDDPVKGADRVQDWVEKHPDLRLLAIPGDGFESHERIVKTGRLSSSEVAAVLACSQGLLSFSRYEGNSLAILEALSLGVPVFSTAVGEAPSLVRDQMSGLVVRDYPDLENGWSEFLGISRNLDAAQQRKEKNRQILLSWKQVAERSLSAVEDFRRIR